MTDIPHIVQELSEAVVLTDVHDGMAVADLHTRLEPIRDWCREQENKQLEELVRICAETLEEIVVKEGQGMEHSMSLVGDIFSVFQWVICEGRALKEVDLPVVKLVTEGSSLTESPAESGAAEDTQDVPSSDEDLFTQDASPTDAAPADRSEHADVEASSDMSDGSPETTSDADSDTSRPPRHLVLTVGAEDAEIVREFVAEAREHLETSDQQLLSLEQDPGNSEAVDAVFRAFHTIKGTAGFLQMADLQELAHEAETLLDMVRKEELAFGDGLSDVIFESVDKMKEMIDLVDHALSVESHEVDDAGFDPLLERLRAAARGETPPPRAIHVDSPDKKLGEILVESGALDDVDLEGAFVEKAASGEPLGKTLVDQGFVGAKKVVEALRGQKASRTNTVRESVKVDADRLDQMIDSLGELVIAQSMVKQMAQVDGASSTPLERHLGHLDKITRELQELGMSLRMVPIRPIFQKMARLVRDLSKKSGKKVELTFIGEETELDKSVVDRIGDPLVHMVRNALDHGIEATPQDRLAAGKTETAHVELRAIHKGGNIFIEIQDDGRGLNRDAIFAKAVERELVQPGDSLSDKEIHNLIFHPGFSTAQQVTDLSGRGVGMDVVKRNIESLRGQIDIQSEPGRGSTFSIRLPLTLAIIDGMVVRVGQHRFVIPTLSIVQSLRPESADLSSVLSRGELVYFNGDHIPLMRLTSVLGVTGEARKPEEGIVVIVEDEGRHGLLVDEILGQQQIVIKTLGAMLKAQSGYSGGAIMPDGLVSLILDVGGLVRLAEKGTPASLSEIPQEVS